MICLVYFPQQPRASVATVTLRWFSSKPIATEPAVGTTLPMAKPSVKSTEPNQAIERKQGQSKTELTSELKRTELDFYDGFCQFSLGRRYNQLVIQRGLDLSPSCTGCALVWAKSLNSLTVAICITSTLAGEFWLE